MLIWKARYHPLQNIARNIKSKARQKRRALMPFHILGADAGNLFLQGGGGGGGWALGPVLMQFWDFSIISLLATVLSLQSFNNSLGDSYIVYLLLDIMFRFTYDEWKLCKILKFYQQDCSSKKRQLSVELKGPIKIKCYLFPQFIVSIG